jgi:hypothetical protein
MSLFPKFDPWAEVEETRGQAAKVANVAKVQPPIIFSKPSSAAPADWDAEDWVAHFIERAAIAEYERGASQEEAEATAFEVCVVRWLDSHPPSQCDPDQCVHCGEQMAEHDAIPLLTGDLWIHGQCHPAWLEERRTQAVEALAGLGLSLGCAGAAE